MPGINVTVEYDRSNSLWFYEATSIETGRTIVCGHHRGSEIGAMFAAEERAAEALASYVHVDTW